MVIAHYSNQSLIDVDISSSRSHFFLKGSNTGLAHGNTYDVRFRRILRKKGHMVAYYGFKYLSSFLVTNILLGKFRSHSSHFLLPSSYFFFILTTAAATFISRESLYCITSLVRVTINSSFSPLKGNCWILPPSHKRL